MYRKSAVSRQLFTLIIIFPTRLFDKKLCIVHKLFFVFWRRLTLKSTSRDVILPINNAALLILNGERYMSVYPATTKSQRVFPPFCTVSFSCNWICLHLCTCSEMAFLKSGIAKINRKNSVLLLFNELIKLRYYLCFISRR